MATKVQKSDRNLLKLPIRKQKTSRRDPCLQRDEQPKPTTEKPKRLITANIQNPREKLQGKISNTRGKIRKALDGA